MLFFDPRKPHDGPTLPIWTAHLRTPREWRAADAVTQIVLKAVVGLVLFFLLAVANGYFVPAWPAVDAAAMPTEARRSIAYSATISVPYEVHWRAMHADADGRLAQGAVPVRTRENCIGMVDAIRARAEGPTPPPAQDTIEAVCLSPSGDVLAEYPDPVTTGVAILQVTDAALASALDSEPEGLLPYVGYMLMGIGIASFLAACAIVAFSRWR